jgi:hypothetical protein
MADRQRLARQRAGQGKPLLGRMTERQTGSLRDLDMDPRLAEGNGLMQALRMGDSATGASTFLKALAGATTGMRNVKSPSDLRDHVQPAVGQLGMMAVPYPSRIIKLPSGRVLERVAKRDMDEKATRRGADPAREFFDWTGYHTSLPGRESGRYRTPGQGDTGMAYNLVEDGKTIGSIRYKVGEKEVYVDSVYIKPEHRGPRALMDLVSQIPKWMEKGDDGEYKRGVSATLANSGIPRLLDMMARRDPALHRAGRGELSVSERGYMRDQRNAERREAIAEKRGLPYPRREEPIQPLPEGPARQPMEAAEAAWRRTHGEHDDTLRRTGESLGHGRTYNAENLPRGVYSARVNYDGNMRILMEGSTDFVNVTPGTYHKAEALVRSDQAPNMRTALRRLRRQGVDIHGGGRST